jgi:hypothetical protein
VAPTPKFITVHETPLFELTYELFSPPPKYMTDPSDEIQDADALLPARGAGRLDHVTP